MISDPERPEDGIPGLYQALGAILMLLRCHGESQDSILDAVKEHDVHHERIRAEAKAMVDRNWRRAS